MRKIVFFGNCQAAVLSGVYAISLAPLKNDIVHYVSCYDSTSAQESLQKINDADIIVAQVFDAGQKFEIDISTTSAEIIWFPTVSLAFLWPYGGVSHVLNQVLPYWSCGPYDYLMGDNFLNKMIGKGVAPEVAVQEYLSLDIAKQAHLDRLHELVMGRQRTRDEKAGMNFADEMEGSFRSEHIFQNHYHPRTRIASLLARQVYRRLGVPEAAIDALTSRWVKTPFERTALPIHPGVAKHFGLSYGHADYRYPYHTGEMLTFEEFALRYASFQWNEPLLQGIATLHWGGHETYREFCGEVEPDRLIWASDALRRGLSQSRGSSLGERALASVLLRQGDRVAALAALQRAVTVDPTDAASQAQLGHLLEELGRHEEAEAAYNAAIASDPTVEQPYVSLAKVLAGAGRSIEAVALMQNLVQVRPGNGYFFYELGKFCVQATRLADAETAFQEAIKRMPDNPRPHLRLAEIAIKSARLKDAKSFVDQAAAFESDDSEITGDIAHIQAALAPSKYNLLKRLGW